MSRKFWLSYQEIARRQFSTPVLIPTGAKRDKGVWPSFFANDLQHNARNVRRKNVQIVHVDDGDHVSLFVKNRDLQSFRETVTPVLRQGMHIAKTKSWPTVQMQVSALDYDRPMDEQTTMMSEVCGAARTLLDFFLENEALLFSTASKEAKRRASL